MIHGERSGFFWSGWVSSFLFSAVCLLPDLALAQPLRGGLAAQPPLTDLDLIAHGKQLSEYYCALCHQYVEPALLDKKTWLGQTLPRMKIRMGMAPAYLNVHPEADAIKATGRIPTEPVMTEAEFKAVVRFYSASAPEKAMPQDPRPPIREQLDLFTVDRRSYRRENPSVTLLKYDSKLQRIIVGHDQQKVIVRDGIPGREGAYAVAEVPVSSYHEFDGAPSSH